jgi:hypothetical protein
MSKTDDVSVSDIADLAQVPRSTGVDAILDIVRRDGGVIIQRLLSDDQVRSLNREFDEPLSRVPPGHPDPSRVGAPVRAAWRS